MSSSSYMPSSDASHESHTPASQCFGHSTPSRFHKRAEHRQAYLNSISSRTIQQFYEHSGALDSQTTESQWENKVYDTHRTPPRTATGMLLRQVQNIELPSLCESESEKASCKTGKTVRHEDVFQVLHEGDITLVEPTDGGGELGKVTSWLKATAADDDEHDIPIASSPLQMPMLSMMSNLEDYNAAIGYTGGAQLPLGASDGPDIPASVHDTNGPDILASVCNASPAHPDEWTRALQPGEIQILLAVHSLVEEETEAI
ncbi:uncharacterized protein EV420DRAFT_1653876 [Desarmillaria tabescens]|uniref:Uncharacterized protein n=1 Tax=Armillaria tabescens TaxID=1929756 RepID=A0AA39J381_ARMTA|nr:uncharacterized protein EV420DRAFT_1653876 [Desarmillaria tabescens]KAK0434670.1 hypothetical protein EV420DRAFT_1653876 [Desarmillaria tabescens]